MNIVIASPNTYLVLYHIGDGHSVVPIVAWKCNEDRTIVPMVQSDGAALMDPTEDWDNIVGTIVNGHYCINSREGFDASLTCNAENKIEQAIDEIIGTRDIPTHGA